jgi:hypothetical protein
VAIPSITYAGRSVLRGHNPVIDPISAFRARAERVDFDSSRHPLSDSRQPPLGATFTAQRLRTHRAQPYPMGRGRPVFSG